MKTYTRQDIEIITRIPAVANILEIVCRTTGMGFAAVAHVTDEKWVACAVRDEIEFGLQTGGELQVETTICHEVHHSKKAVAIDHVETDGFYACHATPAMYGFQSYISVPIILKNGEFFGTLCAIDPNPNHVNNPQITGMFNLFADLIAFYINSNEQLTLAQTDLIEERKTAELREQFIAVLGHDLRNPVNAIVSSAQILQQMTLDEAALNFVNIIRNSTYRINGLIDNVLDFARGRLGDGITLQRKDNVPIENVLNEVIDELRVVRANRVIDIQFDLSEPVNYDVEQIAQLFSNLLSNAITHGSREAPVTVRATSDKKAFILSVCNSGNPIPADVMNRLFQPFYRGEGKLEKQGLGLGLYIASEIARAHGGTLTVSSTLQCTCFTFHLPACKGTL